MFLLLKTEPQFGLSSTFSKSQLHENLGLEKNQYIGGKSIFIVWELCVYVCVCVVYKSQIEEYKNIYSIRCCKAGFKNLGSTKY